MWEQQGRVSGDWNVYYIGYSHSLIKYLIKIFQGEQESRNELKFASPPVRYLKDNSKGHRGQPRTSTFQVRNDQRNSGGTLG